MHVAARTGGLDILRALVTARGDIHSRHTGPGPQSPVDIAINSGHSDLVDYLVSLGAKPSEEAIALSLEFLSFDDNHPEDEGTATYGYLLPSDDKHPTGRTGSLHRANKRTGNRDHTTVGHCCLEVAPSIDSKDGSSVYQLHV